MRRNDDEELRRWLTRLREALNDLRPLHNAWHYYDGLYQGTIPAVEARVAQNMQTRDYTTLNVVFWMVETITPLLSDAAPTWYVKTLGPGGDDIDDALTTALQAVAQKSGFLTEYKTALRDQLIRGTGFMRALWNTEAGERRPFLGPGDKLELRPTGDVEVRWLDPYSVVPDPAARNIDEAEWIAIRTDLPLDRAKRMWPEFDEEKAEALTTAGEDASQRPIQRALQWLARAFGMLPNPEERMRLFRIWELYHDGGRRLTIFSGQQVLWDGMNPLPSQRYPLVCLRLCPRGDNFWGMPLVSQIEGLQRQITSILTRLHQYVRVLGSPPIVTNDAQVAQQLANRLTQLPGTVLQVGGIDRFVRFMEVPQVPAWVWEMLREDIENVKAIAGIADVLRGVRPGSIQSGVAIQALQESAMTRLRDMGTDNAHALQRLGELVLEYMQVFYNDERQFVLQRGSTIKTATVRPEMLRFGQVGFLPGEAEEEEPGVEQPRRMWVVVEPGATLPLSAAARAELALRLYQLRDPFGLPVIDDEALLDAVAFPGRRTVLQRKRAMMSGMMQAQTAQQAAMQQAAMQQAGMPGMEGMPPEEAMAAVAEQPPGLEGVTPEQLEALMQQMGNLTNPEELV